MLNGLEFREPLFLLLLLITPLIYFFALRLPSSIIYSDLKLLTHINTSWKIRFAKLPALLFFLAAIALVIALAGPRTGDATTEVQREGIAIMLVVDRSGSMNARDFVKDDYSINRLDAVKDVLHQFISGTKGNNGREDDLIGLITFGTYADGICPLTLDHKNLLFILDDIQVAEQQKEASTAIGEGLGLAVERLRHHPAKSKVIILLTDGMNTAGTLEPIQAAELAAKYHIKVYTIGAGSSGYAPIVVKDRNGQEYLQRAYVEIDEDTLKDIAKITHGRYFHAKNADALQKTYAEIDKLERSKITEVHYLQYREHYVFWVISALLSIAIALIMNSTIFRRLP